MKTTIDPAISPKEAAALIADEERRCALAGQTIDEIQLDADDSGGIVFTSYPVRAIRRIRRITGYLSEVHRFTTRSGRSCASASGMNRDLVLSLSANEMREYNNCDRSCRASRRCGLGQDF